MAAKTIPGVNESSMVIGVNSFLRIAGSSRTQPVPPTALCHAPFLEPVKTGFATFFSAFCRHVCTTCPQHVAKKSLNRLEGFICICAYARRAAHKYTMVWTRVQGSTKKRWCSQLFHRAPPYLSSRLSLYLRGCVSVCMTVCLWGMVVHTKPSLVWPAIAVWNAGGQQQSTGSEDTTIDAWRKTRERRKRRSPRKQRTANKHHTLTMGTNKENESNNKKQKHNRVWKEQFPTTLWIKFVSVWKLRWRKNIKWPLKQNARPTFWQRAE